MNMVRMIVTPSYIRAVTQVHPFNARYARINGQSAFSFLWSG